MAGRVLRLNDKGEGFYKRLHCFSSVDVDEGLSTKRRSSLEKTVSVNCLLDKRVCTHGEPEYLVHWEGLSIFDATWEPSAAISEDLVRAYEDGILAPGLVSQKELREAADAIIVAVQRKVKRGSTVAESCPCRRDILVHWFSGKAKIKGAWVLKEEDFPKELFPPGWDAVLDVHGQGPKVLYPIFLKPAVRRSTKRFVRSESGNMIKAQQAVFPQASLRFSTEQTSA